jgi:hypothetical protein
MADTAHRIVRRLRRALRFGSGFGLGALHLYALLIDVFKAVVLRRILRQRVVHRLETITPQILRVAIEIRALCSRT